MKKEVLFVCVFMGLIGFVNAQKISENQIAVDIQKIAELKVEYEKYRNNERKGDSIFNLYKWQIDKIKKSPKIYLSYINRALKRNKIQLKDEVFPYKYLTVTEANVSLRRHLIKKIDFYRVVKYYLYRKDKEILPEDFRGLKVVDEKNYNGYDKTKREDFKLAKKFLLSNLPLTS